MHYKDWLHSSREDVQELVLDRSSYVVPTGDSIIMVCVSSSSWFGPSVLRQCICRGGELLKTCDVNVLKVYVSIVCLHCYSVKTF